ncbi:hypothetical protein [Nocardia sp. N2S4-5]|uniref:hypothetical protein n=1 Tax=Nocardia sp. N2S4-5 TaxID=3351565 RepID=UPI0037D4A205
MFKSFAAAGLIAIGAALGITVIESTAVVATAQAQSGLAFRFDSEQECRAFESYQAGQGWRVLAGCHQHSGYDGLGPGWYTRLTA